MIFVTVGTQLPFDRLVREIDRWAGAQNHIDVFAQIGENAYIPENMDWAHNLQPAEFRERMHACDTVVAHAGMGSIISAIELGKRVIVVPRRAEFGEHRNDHQLATVARLEHIQNLEVALECEELAFLLARSRPDNSIADAALQANGELISAVRRFAGLEAA
jgi:UDP-N-acetylglucosamine transferase subunit ALG13